ncbi:hypothetical protein TOPH_07343 [Tolypocladium ophioglossoides CBS 100239]|uniref:Uncharacterized protein n=1 Tax=Tolypocladium ophioglossoides (strain CBS 100239) TaxID=1163406 RepID=A0A0L0N270_TOLOC|nr:hypothetical protein TOPH_07343 [Tolypocladium ophioglossoides CBS 100239]
MSDPHQTSGRDFEEIRWRYFEPVNYERFMSWEASSSGTIVINGVPRPTTEAAEKDVSFPANARLTVSNTKFKLVSRC